MRQGEGDEKTISQMIPPPQHILGKTCVKVDFEKELRYSVRRTMRLLFSYI